MARKIGTKKRSVRAVLSRERVFEAAIAIADRNGLAALTMRSLAQALGVEAMSLYHHVANREAILDGMVDAVFAEITLPRDDDWKVTLRLRALSARAALLRHRWAIGLMDSRRQPGPATLRHHDDVIGVLLRAGFSMALTAHAYSLLDSYIYGFVLQETSLPFDAADGMGEGAQEIIDAMPRDEFPNLRALAIEHVLRAGYSPDSEFAFGLDLILEGLASSFKKPC